MIYTNLINKYINIQLISKEPNIERFKVLEVNNCGIWVETFDENLEFYPYNSILKLKNF